MAQKINAIYQKSYAPQIAGVINPNNRLPLSNSPTQTPNEAVVKLDHIIREQDHLSGSWIYNHKPRTLVDSCLLYTSARRNRSTSRWSRRDGQKPSAAFRATSSLTGLGHSLGKDRAKDRSMPW